MFSLLKQVENNQIRCTKKRDVKKWQIKFKLLAKMNTGRCGQEEFNGKPSFLFWVRDGGSYLSKEKMLLLLKKLPVLRFLVMQWEYAPFPLLSPAPLFFSFSGRCGWRGLCVGRGKLTHIFNNREKGKKLSITLSFWKLIV